MLQYIFLFILLASLVTVATVIVRKFPQVANLDLESLPFEIEARKKQNILRQRLESQSKQIEKKLKKRFAPLIKFWGKVQLQFRIYVGKVERLLHHEQRLKLREALKNVAPETKQERLDDLISQGQEALAAGSFNQAEELFITAIKLDAANAAAYRGLADTYRKKGSYDEAMQTYAFVLKLKPEDDSALVQMAELSEQNGKLESAIEYYERAAVLNDSLSPRFYHLAELLLKVNQPETAKEAVLSAVELEPKNPKYLDLLIETAILASDRKTADAAWQEFRLINPENQKIEEFRSRIDQLQ